jgi:hypothetical protein
MSVDPEVGKAAFRWALLLIIMAGGLLLFLTPGSPEYYAAAFTVLLGLALTALVILVVRRFSR